MRNVQIPRIGYSKGADHNSKAVAAVSDLGLHAADKKLHSRGRFADQSPIIRTMIVPDFVQEGR